MAPRDLLAVINLLPSVNLCDPEVFVAVGVQTSNSSWSDQRINISSCVVVPISCVPKHITCLSVPDTRENLFCVGALDSIVAATGVPELADVSQ